MLEMFEIIKMFEIIFEIFEIIFEMFKMFELPYV